MTSESSLTPAMASPDARHSRAACTATKPAKLRIPAEVNVPLVEIVGAERSRATHFGIQPWYTVLCLLLNIPS